ncbi:poxvirus early transcription factor (VETF) large subunit [Faustovirus]|nr:poxvirus early transcription factor (VETF) large subunit [Faustovirus]QJX73585.1 poxvirus early transcription factor (VETF) large subunit [Faustovirus]
MSTGATQNFYSTNPLRIHCVSKDGQVKQQFVCVDVSKRLFTILSEGNFNATNSKALASHFGDRWASKLLVKRGKRGGIDGGIDDDVFDIDNIEQLLETTEPEATIRGTTQTISQTLSATGEVHYINNIHFYPIDKYSELRLKTQVITGIPYYRQHIYVSIAGNAVLPYKLFAMGIYDADITQTHAINATSGDNTDTIHGIPIDKWLFDNRDESKVEILEDFKTLDDIGLPVDVYVYDLADYVGTSFFDADEYQLNLVYNGFVIKYFPQLTFEAFKDYVNSESDFVIRYGDLAPDTATLRNRFIGETRILDAHYSIRKANHQYAITFMQSMVESGQVTLDIRKLFDHLHTDLKLPEMYAFVNYGNQNYLLRKYYHLNASNIQIPIDTNIRKGLTVAISLRRDDQLNYHIRTSTTLENDLSRYLYITFMPDGKYFMKTIWSEELKIDFEELHKKLKVIVNPLIEAVNALGGNVFGNSRRLQLVSKSNIIYKSLNVSVYYNRGLNSDEFRELRRLFESYNSAGITQARQAQQFSRYEILWCKGLRDYDTSMIEKIIGSVANISLNNQYIHFSNNTVKQKWDAQFAGKTLRIHQRTTDVKFEILNIHENDFDIFASILATYLAQLTAAITNNVAVRAITDVRNVKRLRKLREQDPVLYNLKKYGHKKVYSVLCQKSRQPTIMTDAELSDNPAIKQRAVEYHNFTTNKPAYYRCENKYYPYFGFITGEHKQGFCLPCCMKTKPSGDSKKIDVYSKCMTEHKYTDDTMSASRYIMNYGKDLEPSRLAYMPAGINDALLNSDTKLLIYGVEQSLPQLPHAGFIFAAAAAIKRDPGDILDHFIKYINSNDTAYSVLLNGKIREYFPDKARLINDMRELVAPNGVRKGFKRWNEVFAELLHRALGYSSIMIIDESGYAEDFNLFMPSYSDSGARFIIIAKVKNHYYPVFEVDVKKYIKTSEIENAVYGLKHPVVENIAVIIARSMKTYTTDDEPAHQQRLRTYVSVREYADKNTITIRKYVNAHNMIYGVDFDGVFIPVAIVNSEDKVEAIRTQPVAVEYDKLVAVLTGVDAYIGLNTKFRVAYMYRGEVKLLIDTVGMTYHVTQIPASVDAPKVELGHDPNEVNKVILQHGIDTVPERSPEVNVALYKIYEYRLFFNEFIKYLANERNESLRKELKKVLVESGSKVKLADISGKLRSVANRAKISRVDYIGLQSLISDYYYVHEDKGRLMTEFDETVFEFDKITLNQLRALEIGEVITQLGKIVGNFAIEGEFKGEFPNILSTCQDTRRQHADYCAGNKVVVENLSRCVTLLASDILNPVKSILFDISAGNVLDYFKFNRRNDEIISVYKL